jgi:hypothetical protein
MYAFILTPTSFTSCKILHLHCLRLCIEMPRVQPPEQAIPSFTGSRRISSIAFAFSFQ